MYKRYLLLSICSMLLLATSCRQQTTTESTMTKQSIPASSNSDTTTNTNKELQKELDELEAKRGNINRTIWQQPRMLIQRLGDLRTKTIADIGAGPFGYFSFQLVPSAKKVIAIDIDEVALDFMDSMRLEVLAPNKQKALEPRLSTPDDPKLLKGEADVVILMNIYAYLGNRANYLQKVRAGMSENGQVLIVDFKMRQLPIGPSQEEKVPLYKVEQELKQAGFSLNLVDDRTLDYQYMVIATKE